MAYLNNDLLGFLGKPFQGMNIFGAKPSATTQLLAKPTSEGGYGLLSQDMLQKAEMQSLGKGLLTTLASYLAQPKNQGYGSALPYLAGSYLQGMTAAQKPFEGLQESALTNLKLDELKKEKQKSIDAQTSVEEFIKQNPKFAPIRNLPLETQMTIMAKNYEQQFKPTESKGLTDVEIQGLVTSTPGLENDMQIKQLLKTDKTAGLKAYQTKYLGGEDGVKYTQQTDKIAKTFANNINPDTGNTYAQDFGQNIKFDNLSVADAEKVLDKVQQNQINIEIAKSKAQYDTPEGQWSRANTLNGRYEQALDKNKFEEMRTAFRQVEASVKKQSPIGDVASATKIMKLLDPGSVVRESELGIALNKTRGLVDRWANWMNQKFTGEQLTESQRQDFYEIATEFYKIAQESKNRLDQKFIRYAQKANVDPEMVVGVLSSDQGTLEYDMTTGKWK